MAATDAERIAVLEDRLARLTGEAKPAGLLALVQRFGTTVFSIGAFVFSVLSALLAFYGNIQRDIHDQRSELRSLITQIQEVPRRAVELGTNTQLNPYQRTVLEGLLNKQNVMLSLQAGQIATGLATHPLGTQIAAAELISVANALATSGLTDKALPLIERALPLADNFSDYADGWRLLAGVRFASQAFDQGRAAMRSALEVWARFPPPAAAMQAYQTAFTEVRWAELELGSGAPGGCAEAARHAGEAEKILSRAGAFADPTLAQALAAVKTQMRSRCGS